MKKLCVIIPAIKNQDTFAEDVLKKLDGISLLRRTINKAKRLVPVHDIYVVTDSQDVVLVSERQDVRCYYEEKISWSLKGFLSDGFTFLNDIEKKYEYAVFLSVHAPLVTENDVAQAFNKYLQEKADVSIPIRERAHLFHQKSSLNLSCLLFNQNKTKVVFRSQAFLILKNKWLKNGEQSFKKVSYCLLSDHAIDIENHNDWWICEKLLQRKKIVFRVIGYSQVGMGHIFRSLALAHEITDHEIIFVCDTDSQVAVKKLAQTDYPVEVCTPQNIEDVIIHLRPDLVVNDMLDTNERYVKRLKTSGIKTVNFEDLGPGALFADLTINELYDDPIFGGKNTKWGHQYFFVRDEFHDATPHRFVKRVKRILITFGGTDLNNFTMKTLKVVADHCREQKVDISVVTGDGYLYKEELRDLLKSEKYSHVEYTSATGVISKIMEKSQVAITSKGRTLYELAHMNIPAIVIPQHAREGTHTFANKAKGFIVFDLWKNGQTEKKLLHIFIKLLEDSFYRRTLFRGIKKYHFAHNKQRVVKMVLNLLSILRKD